MEDLRSYNIRQAVDSGKRALQEVKDLEKDLSDARWWCYADLMSVSMLLAYCKRQALMDINTKLDLLQHSLELFQQELDSLTSIKLPIEDLGARYHPFHYFGWVFTGPFTERQINAQLTTLAECKTQIRGILHYLEEAPSEFVDIPVEELSLERDYVTL